MKAVFWGDKRLSVPKDITPYEVAGLIHLYAIAQPGVYSTIDLEDIFDHYQLDRLFK